MIYYFVLNFIQGLVFTILAFESHFQLYQFGGKVFTIIIIRYLSFLPITLHVNLTWLCCFQFHESDPTVTEFPSLFLLSFIIIIIIVLLKFLYLEWALILFTNSIESLIYDFLFIILLIFFYFQFDCIHTPTCSSWTQSIVFDSEFGLSFHLICSSVLTIRLALFNLLTFPYPIIQFASPIKQLYPLIPSYFEEVILTAVTLLLVMLWVNHKIMFVIAKIITSLLFSYYFNSSFAKVVWESSLNQLTFLP